MRSRAREREGGARTLLLTLNLDRIAWQPCNPAVGGPAKSQLVHEIDALGGAMGVVSDKTYLQKRVLNASRGPAVWALRAQTDKWEYSKRCAQSWRRGQSEHTGRHGDGVDFRGERRREGRAHVLWDGV